MTDIYCLRKNGNMIKCFNMDPNGQTAARTDLDALIAADLTTYTNQYNNAGEIVEQVNISDDKKAIRLTQERNGLDRTIKITNTIQRVLVVYEIVSFESKKI